MRLDVFLTVELFGEVEAIERAYHRPAGDHIGEAGIDVRMIRQRQRGVSRVSRPQRAEHDLMAAAGIAERADNGGSVEVGRMRLEPANAQIDVADRSRIARLGRL